MQQPTAPKSNVIKTPMIQSSHGFTHPGRLGASSLFMRALDRRDLAGGTAASHLPESWKVEKERFWSTKGGAVLTVALALIVLLAGAWLLYVALIKWSRWRCKRHVRKVLKDLEKNADLEAGHATRHIDNDMLKEMKDLQDNRRNSAQKNDDVVPREPRPLPEVHIPAKAKMVPYIRVFTPEGKAVECTY